MSKADDNLPGGPNGVASPAPEMSSEDLAKLVAELPSDILLRVGFNTIAEMRRKMAKEERLADEAPLWNLLKIAHLCFDRVLVEAGRV